MKKTLIVSGLVVGLLSGCGELKKVDDMHDATGKMADTTDKMNNTTSQMNKTTTEMNGTTSEMKDKMTSLEKKTEELKQITDELYDTLRQGNALQLRREAMTEIVKAPTLFRKISESNKYMMSFEFQIWNNLGQDAEPEKRDLLAQQAALEFFLDIEGFAPRDNSVNVLAEPDMKDLNSQDNRTASFNALAAAMHQVNRKETRAEKNIKNLPNMTMYAIMEKALLASREEQQSGASREVMAHEDKAIQILQTRYSLFPLIFIDSVSKVGDKSLVGKAKMMMLGWEFDIDCLNATQLEYLQTEVLQQSLQSKQLLLKLGKKPVLDSTVAKFLAKMKVKASGKMAPAVINEQTKLLGLLAEIQK
ncbi:hypothetical protein [Bdellovibrio sp. NC01]|uniref:hypothetical protein n=1 Tax=Bdellovibrio sp. NC01 TaxID=2220073 RepID=UPI001157E8F8|nr:hypothetical protein [Bdellovibrio sp. NC01]QDK36995.1 hypothetical protein DOE51_05000 [Bdellovibrio sp. NC01]